MSVRRSLDLLVLRNTGTYGTPTWTAVANVRDLTGTDNKAEGDASIRGVTVAMKEPCLREIDFSFEMVHDPLDPDYIAFQTAYLASSSIEIAMADGPIATVGTSYFRYTCKVFDWSRSENLNDIAKRNITLKPCWTTNAQGALTTVIA